MCSSSFLFTKNCLLFLCTIILSTCGGEIGSIDEATIITSTFPTTIIDGEADYGREELTTIKSVVDEEAKLPVDLLSDDVLLDPNVVLARLSRRDLYAQDNRRQPEHYDEYNDWYKSRGVFTRRQDYNFKNPYEKKSQEIIHKRMKIYPVFPGK